MAMAPTTETACFFCWEEISCSESVAHPAMPKILAVWSRVPPVWADQQSKFVCQARHLDSLLSQTRSPYQSPCSLTSGWKAPLQYLLHADCWPGPRSVSYMRTVSMLLQSQCMAVQKPSLCVLAADNDGSKQWMHIDILYAWPLLETWWGWSDVGSNVWKQKHIRSKLTLLVWDCLSQRYLSASLGEPRNGSSSFVRTITLFVALLVSACSIWAAAQSPSLTPPGGSSSDEPMAVSNVSTEEDGRKMVGNTHKILRRSDDCKHIPKGTI